MDYSGHQTFWTTLAFLFPKILEKVQDPSGGTLLFMLLPLSLESTLLEGKLREVEESRELHEYCCTLFILVHPTLCFASCSLIFTSFSPTLQSGCRRKITEGILFWDQLWVDQHWRY